MNIAILQGSTQIDKNQLLFESTKAVVGADDNVFNFGLFKNDVELSYVQVSILIGLLINSKAIDYVITGCSSGNGMNIACNSLPNIISGYLPTPSDAFLFGRINNGNCVSLPLGLNFGWAGELNLKYTLEKLFSGPMNTYYPNVEAKRKKYDSLMLKKIKSSAQNDMITIIDNLDSDFIKNIYQKKDVFNYIFENGTNKELVDYLSYKFFLNNY